MNNEDFSLLNIIINSIVAIGTLTLAFVAVFKEKLTYWLASPNLVITLREVKGSFTTNLNGNVGIYYHLQVQNKNTWATAKNVRVLCTSISRLASDRKTYIPEPRMIPIQLMWSFPQYSTITPNIGPEQVCDLGCLYKNQTEFDIATYIKPMNFRGNVKKDETVRISIQVVADNFSNSNYYNYEISWDGQWDDNLDELQKHLIVKEV